MAKKLPIEELEKRAPKEELVVYYSNHTLVETLKHFGLSQPQCDRLFEHYQIERRSRSEAFAMAKETQSANEEGANKEIEVSSDIVVDDEPFEVAPPQEPIVQDKIVNGRVDEKELLKKKLSEYFKESKIRYFSDYKPNNGTVAFDFAIFKNGKLDLLVDCDWVLYEFDETRQLAVPQGVKFFAVATVSDFSYIDRLLKLDFNQYVQETFTRCKNGQFPSIDTVLSDDIIENWYKDFSNGSDSSQFSRNILEYYHPSVLECNKRGKVRPLDVWQFDKLLVSCIIRGYLYPCSSSISYRATTGITHTEVAPMATIVDPVKIKYLINKYLSEFDTVFSPTIRFSETLLATCSLNKKFIGEDTHKKVVSECAKLIEGLKLDASVKDAEPLRLKRYYDCLLAIVPFSDEVILSQSNTMSSDDYIDQWVKAFNCNKYVFIVDSTQKYKQKISETIIDGDRKLKVVVISK